MGMQTTTAQIKMLKGNEEDNKLTVLNLLIQPFQMRIKWIKLLDPEKN